MAKKRPTITELMKQQSVDLSAQLGISSSQVARSNAGVIAKVQAGGLHGAYGYLENIIPQHFEDTADDEHLIRRASIRGKSILSATNSSGSCTISGADGESVDVGTVIQRIDGEQFSVTSSNVIVDATALIEVEALVAGANANTLEGEELQFISPVAGISSTLVSNGLSGGADKEATESLRTRTLADIREPPMGGADRDYKKWALETPNVNVGSVWVHKKWMGLGTVGVFFTLADGSIPSTADVGLVHDYMEEEYPIGADLYVIAPTESLVNINITDLSPDTATVRTAISDELAHLFIRVAQVEDGSDNAKIRVSHIREAISIALGESNHALQSPAADVYFEKGELPRLGEITWT